jgi:phospholipid-binding lipoprotein MlaA
VPRRTKQSLLWAAIVVAVCIVGRTSTHSATVDASESSHHETQRPSLRHVVHLIDSADLSRQTAIAPLMTGLVDANIPPEALRLVAWQQLSLGKKYVQALSEDDNEDFFDDEDLLEYDPWEGFNRAMFAFNRQVDRFVLKPVATVWNTVVPELAQQSLSNAFDNLAMPRRLVNNIFQLQFEGAGRELARFFLNISMGVLGFFDAAADLGLPKISDEDTGLTLGHYGVPPGPYLVLPFLPPLTVRDAFGFAADAAMSPLSYFIPFEANAGMRGGQVVNERSLNLDFFEQLERETFDLYTAVRNAYLQRRQRALEE